MSHTIFELLYQSMMKIYGEFPVCGQAGIWQKNKKYTDEIIVFNIDVLKIKPDILFLHCSLQ